MPQLPELFPGFATETLEVDGLKFFARVGGSGPPLLCLHGYPETHACWHRIAPKLAESHTVVAMDMRGYGQSSAPPSDAAHLNYAKRTMARDCIGVMRALGHTQFSVMGHDRGAQNQGQRTSGQTRPLEWGTGCPELPNSPHVPSRSAIVSALSAGGAPLAPPRCLPAPKGPYTHLF